MCHCEEGKARRTQGYHYSTAPASPGIEVSNRKTNEKKGITTLAQNDTSCHCERPTGESQSQGLKSVRLLRRYTPTQGIQARKSHSARQLVLYRNDKQAAFTLAEVLITLGIIGVVAAVTLPALITNVQSRIRAEQIRSAKYKFTLATDKMNSLGLIGPYDSTEAFVKELQKHLKIAKVCPPGKLEGCWPTKEVKIDNDGTMFEINKAVTGKQFKMENDDKNDYTSNNVGIVTADGVPMIISYNSKCEPLDSVKQYAWTTEDNKPVSNATAGCVAAVMDINGSKKPNKLSEDVVLFNAKGLGSGCGMEIDGKCFSAPIASYAPMTKAECQEAVAENKFGIKWCYYENDYWAGAVKACGGVGKMATMADLGVIATTLYGVNVGATSNIYDVNYNTSTASNLGLPNPSFTIWSNVEYEGVGSRYRTFYSDKTKRDDIYSNRNWTGILAVCLSD